MSKITQEDLKLASRLLLEQRDENQQLRKHAEATSVLLEQVERGMVTFPRTAREFEQKIAEIASQDLKVIREAMKLASGPGTAQIGTLGDTTGSSEFAEAALFAAVMGGVK